MRKIQLKDVSGVAAGRTALFNCPIGPRYQSITFVLGDSAAGNGNAPTVAAIVNEMRANYFGGIQRRVTGTQMDVINTAMGAGFASTQAVTGGANGTGRRHLTMFFNEPWRKRSLQGNIMAEALAWQTGFFGKGDSFLMELDLVAGITPVLTAFAMVDDFNGGKAHPIVKWDKNDAPAVGSPIEFSKLDRRDAYLQLSLFDTSDTKTIDRVRLVQGSTEIHDLASTENTTLLKNFDMNPAAGAYHVVFDIDDALQDAVVASGLQLTATPSAAANGTLPIIGQRIGLPE
jgi:hypothetical protein